MSENKKVLFRSSVNGFNKDDVISYIAKLNSELEETDNKLSAALAQIDTLNASLEKEKEFSDAAKAEASELKAKLSEQEAVISAQYEKLDTLNENVQKSSEEKSSYEASSNIISEKAELYDKMSAQIGDLIISAKKDADKIVEKTITNADTMLENVKSKISENAEKVNKNIVSELYAETNECYKDATDYMNYIQSEINRLLNDFVEQNKKMNDKIYKTHSSLSDKLEKEISDFKEKTGKNSVNLYLDIQEGNNKQEV